jgi:endonuclease/exonuclease/phosphatase family metal-dependent hydrolase
MVAIYIFPNPKLDEVEHFIHRALMEYTEEGSKILGTNGNKPLILAGDFNINFADKKSERLTTFLSEKLNLKMNND